ncbi:chromogranin-A isoform X1 [Synchiropus splendidus]|uniref:chromogranin-A isoform X1 n=1 Tax=Synchiropus splendidus TaxID=270530 RepID=UPI00237DD083|nr:chromogranin-A isoform X1 [Synchiropus splendidus]
MRALLVLALLANSVLSAPVTPLDNDDAKVMKCIVEVLADVLSKPHPQPVSHECMLTLKTDERLIPILRHMNFLQELQEIALTGSDLILGHEERDQLTPDHVTRAPEKADMADRSMLEALGGPGERSILSQKTEDEEARDERRGQDREEPQQDVFGEVTREHQEKPKSPGSSEEWDLEKKSEEEESGERRANMKANSDETSEEDDSEEPKHSKSQKEKKRHGNEKKRRAELVSHSHEDADEEEGMKRGSKEGLFSSNTKSYPLKKTKEKEVQGGSHHSKEVSEEEEEEEEKKKKRSAKKSPEEKELQMIAQRTPEEKKVLEEEGSAVRKSEDQEIESLAAIESELENVAQKLHDLRQG